MKGASSVTDIQTYAYTITNEEITEITIYVRADKEPIYLYAWDANGTLTSAWPGTQLSAKKSANGQNFYYMNFPKPSADYTLNYILNQGSDGTKTPDQTGIGSTVFTALGEGAAIDLTATYAGATITDPVEATEPITVYVKGNFGPAYLYTWDGYSLGAWPGTKMNTTLINGKTWFYYTMPKTVTSFNMKVNQGQGQPESNDYYVTSTVYLEYHGGSNNLTIVEGMAEYPVEGWYEQGEICAFFTDRNNWDKVYAWVWSDTPSYYNYSNDNTDNTGWPGNECECLGYNESGYKLYKWTYKGSRTSYPEKIIFNNNNGDNQTIDCNFVNGAWYDKENLKTEENPIASPVSTAVSPSTEISVAALGNPTSVTNWNGKSEKVAENTNNETISKDFTLAAGNYVVQAIVRGTNSGSVTLSAKEQSETVTLMGLDGAASTVQTNGIVETYATGANNGWQKVEVAFTLANAEKVTVTLSSTAGKWQLGAMKVLSGTTAKTKATTGVDLATNTYIDVRGESDFSFYERGANCNALIKAAPNTLPALLPYNVIVDGVCGNLKLTDGNYSFKNNEAFTATNASYDRTFVPGQRSTICLPFALTEEEAAAAGTFWSLTRYDTEAQKLHFDIVTEPQANTPYIFEAAKAQPFLSISGKIVPASSQETVTKDGIRFIGVNERTHLVSVENGVTYYGYRQSDATFVKVGTTNGANINPFRAYLQTSTPLSARMAVDFDDEEGSPTGIQDVKPASEPVGQQPIYNLAGQRVMTPNKKGLYIIGGKKYYVK